MRHPTTTTCLLLTITPLSPLSAFHIPTTTTTTCFIGRTIPLTAPPPRQQQRPISHYHRCSSSITLTKLKKDDNSDSSDDSMESAFKSLNELSSFDDEDNPYDREKMKKLLEKNADKKMGDKIVELSLDDTEVSSSTPEKDFEMYSQMLSELEDADGATKTYSDIMGELSGEVTSPSLNTYIPPDDDEDAQILREEPTLYEDVDGLSEESKEDFMERAIKEAVEEATVSMKNTSEGDKEGEEDAARLLRESIARDEEMRREIEALFESANKKLMDAVEDIREEQRLQTEKLAAARTSALEEEERRLREARSSVSRLVEKVNKETAEVEAAARDLEAAKDRLQSDPLTKFANLRGAGVVKQSVAVLSLLFVLRGVGDGVLGGGVESAAIQIGLGLVFGVLFLVL